MYQSIVLPHFSRQLKPHIKKHRQLKVILIKTLEQFNKEQHIHLGNSVYKIRLKSPDLAKGKSKSFRLIVLVMETEQWLIPIAFYFKGDDSNLSKAEINEHLEIILLELSTSSNNK